jgi:thymidylate synthase (FAD)
MQIIDQYFMIEHFDPETAIKLISDNARRCYKSPKLETYAEQCEFVDKLIHKDPDNPHLSPLEHSTLSVTFVTNLGASHELVRHRLASINQESTRYCNYSKDRFSNEITFIRDPKFTTNDEDYQALLDDCAECEKRYFNRLARGHKPEEARGVLNNDIKTELCITTNYREWRHILKLRTSPGAHYQVRDLMIPLRGYLAEALPCVFGDLTIS